MFVVTYGIIFSMGIYYINRLINRGPEGSAISDDGGGMANTPLGAARAAAREAISKP